MYTVGEIAAIVGGRLLRPESATPTRCVHDSRDVHEGDLFVALPGRRTNGHAHLQEAFARGACAALISDLSAAPPDARNLILVDDTLGALQRLAAAWRRTLDATFVGITGSNGKTTTRALLAHLLGSPGDPAISTAPKNYNTEIGLPLALLAATEATSIGLFELGAERPGDIALLAEILAPQIALITSVGPSHLDGFGSIEAVAREKWSLVERLGRDGLAIVNADSSTLRRRAESAALSTLTVGIEQGAVRGRLVRDLPRLEVVLDDPPMRLSCPLVGRHNATNLLLAALTAHRLSVPSETIEERTTTFEPVPHRLRPIPSSLGTILDDTYNANPTSTAGALDVLARFGSAGALRVFVFGEMRELGPETDRYHDAVVALALRLGIDRILPVGERAIAACNARPSPRILVVDRDELVETIRKLCRGSGDAVVLVKGSRALELERLIDAL